jgi:hypothetical protein
MIIAGANELVVMLVCCLDVDVPNEPTPKPKKNKRKRKENACNNIQFIESC